MTVLICHSRRPWAGELNRGVAAGVNPAAALASSQRRLFGLGLFDQHHRDAVNDRVQDLAVGAAQLIRFLELDLGVAFRARQNFEQL